MSQKMKGVAETSQPKLRAICIISSTDLVNDVSLSNAARELGKEMAARKINLVYGGGTQGLGATMALTVLNNKGTVLGITQENYSSSSSSDNSSFSFGRKLNAKHPYERMVLMLQNCDAFIVMPGGMVILEMFASTMLWATAKVHKKPVGFLNTNGFFDGLLYFLTRADQQGFIPQGIRDLIGAAPTPSQLIDLLQTRIANTDPLANQIVPHTENKRKRDEPDTDLRL